MNHWSEVDSKLYKQLAHVAVPDRAMQIATLLTLAPFEREAKAHIVELASGEGYLSAAMVAAFPNATLTALDYSEEMRATTQGRLQPYAGRFQVASFDMKQSDWYTHLDTADYVVTSLCVHHLNADEKQQLFKQIQQRLSEKGAFMIADILQPQTATANHLFAETWEQSAQQQSVDETGSSAAYELFVKEEWNLFHHPDESGFDQPSPLFHQLLWLQAAGFSVVDCYWMHAGHAIFGGYQSAPAHNNAHLAFNDAFAITAKVLKQP